MKGFAKDLITSICIVVGLFIILFVVTYLGVKTEQAMDTNAWNDGYCPVCGSPWRFLNASDNRGSTTFIYVCDEGTTLRLHHYEREVR